MTPLHHDYVTAASGSGFNFKLKLNTGKQTTAIDDQAWQSSRKSVQSFLSFAPPGEVIGGRNTYNLVKGLPPLKCAIKVI